MAIRLGDTAPDFTADTTEGTIEFHKYLGDGWGILFSHPKDYTPVCTTELGRVANLKSEFDKRNVKVLALSVDPVDSHKGWVNDINETQSCSVNYPIIADPDKKIAGMYDMIHPNALNNLTVRSTGRNFDEILRVIDSLQLTANYQVATPVDWKHGDDCVVVPAIKTEDIPAKFPKGHKVIKPYLRTTPQPDL